MSNYYHIKKHCRKGTAVQPDMHLTNANNDSDWLQRRVNRRFQLHHKLRCKLQHVPTSGYIVRLSVLCMFVCFFIYLHFFLLCFHPLSCSNPLFNHHLSHLPVITVRLRAFVLCTTSCKHTISKILHIAKAKHLSKGSNLKSTSDLTVI